MGKPIINTIIQGTTPIFNEIETLPEIQRIKKKAQSLETRLNVFVSKLPFTFKKGIYDITIKDIKVEGNGLGVWYYAKRNGEFVAAHSPYWVYNIPLFIELSRTLDSDDGTTKTYTRTIKEDIVNVWIDGMIRNLDACDLGDPIGDDVSDIFASYSCYFEVSGKLDTLTEIRAETTATLIDWTARHDNYCTIRAHADVDRYTKIDRTGFSFDTSSLTGKNVSKVDHYVYADSADTTLINPQANFEAWTPASDTAFVVADFDNTNTTKLSDTDLVWGTNISAASWGYLPYNAAGIALIDKTGYTTTMIRHNSDQGSLAPGWVASAFSYIWITSVHDGTHIPYLHITYASGPSAPLVLDTSAVDYDFLQGAVATVTKTASYKILRTTPSAVTKTAQYEIARVTTPITKTAVYEILRVTQTVTKAAAYKILRITPTTVTKSAAYQILRITPTTLTKSAAYEILRITQTVTKTAQFTIQRVTKTISPDILAVYKILRITPTTLTKTAQYEIARVTTPITKTARFLIQSIKQNVAPDVSSKHNLLFTRTSKNLLTQNQATGTDEHDDTADFVALTGGSVITSDDIIYLQGERSLKCVCPDLLAGEGVKWVVPTPAIPGRIYTLSAYLFGVGSVLLGIVDEPSADGANSGTITLTPAWTRYEVSYTVKDGNTGLWCYVTAIPPDPDAMFYIDCIQLEIKH